MRKIIFLLGIMGILASCSPKVTGVSQNYSTETEFVESIPTDADYALLHIYRSGLIGAAVGYDLYIGDALICHVKNKMKETVKIDQEGLNTLWAKTESKTELPINIQFGHEYYIKCSVKMGVVVGRPKLEIVDNKKGRSEYSAIKEK
ncbi:hypothetical protein FACS189426_10090 [Bacteroidia bacterium]|nr:hypothetical protein FACS189426_10090 [Bacteroidia bacterium]GHV70921.1 hypothetical protein FACS189420_4000 [Bacteroidia bacterium]